MPYLSKGRTLILSILGVLFAVIIGLLAGNYLTSGNDRSTAMREAGIVTLPSSRGLPAGQLVSTRGEQINTQNLTGKWSLVFFGYTFCPDI